MYIQLSSWRRTLGFETCKVKVKCTFVQALRICTGRTAHRGSRVIALLFLDHGTRRGEASASRAGRSLPPGKTRYTLCSRLSGAPGPVWTGEEKLAPTGIRSSDRPTRSHALYRLSYRAHFESCRRHKLKYYFRKGEFCWFILHNARCKKHKIL